MSKAFSFSISFLVAGLLIVLFSCQATSFSNKKINGISLEASRDSLTEKTISSIEGVNANAVALMPYAFLRIEEKPQLLFDMERQWFGESAEGIEQAVKKLHKRGLTVMIKPQLWIRGKFTGDLDFEKEENWQKFEGEYREYILLFTGIAAENEVEILCLGTELFNFVQERPQFWKKLIGEIRENYKGKLVYAENWDKVGQVTIWEDLDFIGVDAYFPISDEISPSNSEIATGWNRYKDLLENLSQKYQKQVLFTEYGYRSSDYALKEPWNSERKNTAPNHHLQAQAYQVLYEDIWTENWLAGGFLWKWHQQENAGGIENDRFTPQNKPAEKVIQKYYGKFRN